MANPKTVPALQLDLPGAPNTMHRIPGVPGRFHPTEPTPVGGTGEITEEQAKALDKDPGVPLKLVRVPARDAESTRENTPNDPTAVGGEEN